MSRFYLNHRFSDDLDFFVNDESSFLTQVQAIQKDLSKNFNLAVIRKAERFARFFLESAGLKLKLEFINDVPFYLGEVKSFELFNRVDNILNILSNKITAIQDRNEPKDFADILCIFGKRQIDWELVFSASQSKAAGIFPPLIAKKFEDFDVRRLDILNWIEPPDYEELARQKDKIVNDIMGIDKESV